MKTRIQWLLLVLLGLVLSPAAQAYYNSTTGRWLSRDPIGEAVASNLYGCLRNDTVGRVDVCGLFDGEVSGSLLREWRDVLKCNCKGPRFAGKFETRTWVQFHQWPDKVWVPNRVIITIEGIPVKDLGSVGGSWVHIGGFVKLTAKCPLPSNNYTFQGFEVVDWGKIADGPARRPAIRCVYRCNFSMGTREVYDRVPGEGAYVKLEEQDLR